MFRSFQSTPSVWRETKVSYPGGCQCHISIHSLRVEGDAVRSASCRSDTHFNPLPPCGGRRLPVYVLPVDRRFQSTPSVWRETQSGKRQSGKRQFQSTPSVWRETLWRRLPRQHPPFQSTPSVWRETRTSADFVSKWFKFQSTPSVWRET